MPPSITGTDLGSGCAGGDWENAGNEITAATRVRAAERRWFLFMLVLELTRICHVGRKGEAGVGRSAPADSKSATESKAAGGGARSTQGIEVVGFRGTGYQRSLRVHESDEYNF